MNRKQNESDISPRYYLKGAAVAHAHTISITAAGAKRQRTVTNAGGSPEELAAKRPGWSSGKSIHQLFLDNGVDIFFYDHEYVYAIGRWTATAIRNAPFRQTRIRDRVQGASG